MPHRILKVAENGMLDAYEATLKARGFKSDPAQRAAAQRLQNLYSDLVAFKAARRGTIRKLLAAPNGIILVTGPTGSGKTTAIYSALQHLINLHGSSMSMSTVKPEKRMVRSQCSGALSSRSRVTGTRRVPSRVAMGSMLTADRAWRVSTSGDRAR